MWRDDVRVEAKCTSWGECGQQLRERYGEDRGPEECGRDGPAHSDFSVRQWKDLGRIGERDRTLTRRVESREQEYEEGNQAEMGWVVLWDIEAEAAGKKSPRHLWEREQ